MGFRVGMNGFQGWGAWVSGLGCMGLEGGTGLAVGGQGFGGGVAHDNSDLGILGSGLVVGCSGFVCVWI